jgi:hypothetical protein
MLRINQQSDAQAAKNYYGSPAEYYGAGEQEMIGEWFGAGADRLGLDGSTILQHQFARLCDNRHPLTGEQLTARTRKGRRVGYDFNFHVCKSLSIPHRLTPTYRTEPWPARQITLIKLRHLSMKITPENWVKGWAAGNLKA